MENLKVSDILFSKLESFCELSEQFAIASKLIEKKKQLSRWEKNELHLQYIANSLIFNPRYFTEICSHFAQFLPKIISISISEAGGDARHKANCVLLANITEIRSDLQSYALTYFETNPSPFVNRDQIGGKKPKMSECHTYTDLDLVKSCYKLLKSNESFYKTKWEWSEFIRKYLNHSDREVQFVACQCIAIVICMSEQQLTQLINTKIPSEIHNQLICKYNSLKDERVQVKSRLDQNPHVSFRKIKDDTVEVSGVFLPKIRDAPDCESNLIIVESTFNNLRKIALGVSSNERAVCLQGPVGSGKTCLIEYLACKTGRKLGEDFIKVQLGDQTDSKMLLGTYCCTDIPGEFIWQPGVITQAVLGGHWLLLEDIDSAGMDIASVLSSLLENGMLNVPGYGEPLRVSPGFQLFFTQRSITTVTGHHKKNTNSMMLLKKQLLEINIDPLNSDELKKIICTKYPKFQTVADRMLNVFHLFTKESEAISIPKTSRLISTRDFFKWCTRAAVDYDVSSQSSALKILQDAIDVFCCSHPDIEDSLALAKEISTNLGIINQKAEYFYKNYKPPMKLTADSLVAGRASVQRNNEGICCKPKHFYFTRPSSVLLERVMCCVDLKEPVLLVGETGTGKTSTVQFLADTIGQKLVVINMNQQSDSADLLGGFKPIDIKFIVEPIRKEFEHIFCDYFQVEPNRKFLTHIAFCYNEQRWSDLYTLMLKSYQAAIKRLGTGSKDEKTQKIQDRWKNLGGKLEKLGLQLKHKTTLAFAFIEGSLVKAVENGYWVLLDEINLANAETLECLSGLLEGSDNSLCLLERGDKKPVKRHKNFTLFACMNPSTDVGKKDLPAGLRNRFTEFFVNELTEKTDLHLLVSSYLEALSLKHDEINRIVDFYLKVRKETDMSLTDGLGHKPHFSLRTLCRALSITARNACGNVKKTMYEAFSLSFLTQLDAKSYKILQTLIDTFLFNGSLVKSIIKQPIPEPEKPDSHVQIEGYWVKKGSLESSPPEDYILTESVRKNLKDLVRIVSIGSLPVLLQGDTSVGKTSLITYLAKSTGNKCIRINNHEHTDLQEYVGCYVADCAGKLVFREGLLVEAMRKGYWIILDELNLAPTDVLEALNRVLDDNRELFIAETQEVVKADGNFMLFATQNPPGAYGGRKMLSRAFRNRFVELHFDEIPSKELIVILSERCQMAKSYAKKMIDVMIDLQLRRRGSGVFAGKKGFITLRDLFRWGERYRLAKTSANLYDWDQHLADEGYLVLAGRVRKSEEKIQIIQCLQKHWKRTVDPQNLFTLSKTTSPVTKSLLEKILHSNHEQIVWTFNMRQLAVLVAKAFQFKEPVLLVGETGCGKTTICQIIAEINSQQLATINCHMHSESSDFIGGLRPVREHENDDLNKLFEWVNGPLIHAMSQGNVFLADEISLADDSVLERLNSLLEPERTLLIAEKGSDNQELIVANENFHFIGTMNPGGDFGKKELSPALRNRFTEIWCEPCTNRDDLIEIIGKNLRINEKCIAEKMMDFLEWFKSTEIGKRFTLSIRDILTWVNFINQTVGIIDVKNAYIQGVYLTFLDSLGSGVTSNENSESLEAFTELCRRFVFDQTGTSYSEPILNVEKTDHKFGIHPFYIDLGCEITKPIDFSFNAPTTLYNTLVLLRGMQLNKAILLEGSPGVGKTSLVQALAKASGNKVFRVNLSDQTDVSDLFGADLPVEGGVGGEFSWRDGPLLKALKEGYWILLDELNLASQSVLEGLNACLDHRGEIYLPELNKAFQVKPGTRFFACQNPLKQGGSRKGLPQSFLNRFIQVYIKSLTNEDLSLILRKEFPQIDEDVIVKMLKFNGRIVQEIEGCNLGRKGGPWEFNLRDLYRWCEATIYLDGNRAESLVGLIYGDRMRSQEDKSKIEDIFEEVFTCAISGNAPTLYMESGKVFIGDATLDRSCDGVESSSCLILRSQLTVLRSLAYAVNLNWMSILVGSSGSGKSALVKTLAGMLGKKLHTLPVTSAMDTTDILGGFEQTDYGRHLEEMSKQTQLMVLKLVRLHLVQGLPCPTVLELWENHSKNGAKTNGGNVENFLKKIHHLQTVWQELVQNKQFYECVQELLKKSQIIIDRVKTDGSLNCGGKFEWVNSILIKCLQEGSWLLIDNVNLCSAAVLDRLNGLLEPEGVLMIGERGVDNEGRVYEIKPHKNFRLFLTMDPKNGEISRAMRNRGLEIYLPTGQCDVFDLKSLVYLNGLCDTKRIDGLLKVHDFVSEMISGEKPTMNELLNVAASVSRQIGHGTEQFHAFYNAILEVYYKSRTCSEFDCNDFESVIRNKIAEILHENQEEFFSETFTLKTDRLQNCSTIELIKQQSCCLQKVLAPEITESTKCAMINFYSLSNGNDLELRHLFIRDFLPEQLGILEDTLYSFVKNFPGEYPFDPTWFIESKFGERNSYQKSVCLHILINLKAESSVQTHELTLLDYMKKRRTKRADDHFNDVLVEKYLDLIETFDGSLMGNVRKTKSLNGAEAIRILELFKWRLIFHRLTWVNIKKITQNQKNAIVTNLKVHYSWFYKYCLKGIYDLLKQSPEGLAEIFDEINENMDNQFSPLFKLGKSYQKAIEKPLPKTTKIEVEFMNSLNELFNNLDVSARKNPTLNILNFFTKNKTVFNQLIDLKTQQNEEFAEKIARLESVKKEIEIDTVDKIDKEARMLMPITDYFMKMKIRKLITSKSDLETNEISNCLMLPLNLIASILLYFNGDSKESLRHELLREYFKYSTNSVCLNSQFHDGDDDHSNRLILTEFSPLLIYHSNRVLLSGGSLVKFGNFKQTIQQYQRLNLILWRNVRQLSDDHHDRISNEIKFLRENFRNFLDTLRGYFQLKTSEELMRKVEALANKSFGKRLRRCFDAISKFDTLQSFDETILFIGNVHMDLSYIKAVFNSRLPLIDPSAKKALKKKYREETIRDFEEMKDCFRFFNDVTTGNEKTLHPYHRPIVETIRKLKENNDKLGNFVAVRPENVSYDDIIKNVNHGFSSVLSSDYLDPLLDSLNDSIRSLLNGENKENHQWQQYNSALSSLENLLNDWCKYSSGYPDIIDPLLSDLSEFLYGFRTNVSLLKKLLLRLVNPQFGVVSTLVKFPGVAEENCIEISKCLGGFIDNDVEKTKQVSRLYKCGALEMFNNCIIECAVSNLKHENFRRFYRLLDEFVYLWDKQESEREKMEKEAESLYKIKSKCDEKSETEQQEDGLKELFPNYHDVDFADIQNAITDQVDDDKFTESVSQEDINCVVDIHLKFVRFFTKTEWLNPPEYNAGADFVLPLVEKYKLFGKILENHVEMFDYRLDKDSIESLSVLLGFVRNPQAFQTTDSTSKSKDFYKDSDVEEVKSSLYIVEDLKVKVNELLDEWPGQPTLQTILDVIERVLNFDLTSPLVRFLTGFEMLLSKCYEWEQVAHSGVSLMEFSSNLCQQVVKWRKLELLLWNDLLNSTFTQSNSKVLHKWWLHLYKITRQFIESDDLTDADLISALQNFIIKSNLGEFQMRLDILYGFHCHVVHLERTEKCERFLKILWNLYGYFKQFSGDVASRIKTLRAPVEKKLKDYVKIVRWKDVNYWVVKQTVEKSHKTLHKYVREFQEILKQPVSGCLTNNSEISDKVGGKKILDSDDPILGNVKYPSLLKNLDETTGQIIETSLHLQKLEVDSSLPKAKQKSHVKSILQQKHRALADLFKILSKMGLSFQSGVLQSKLKKNDEEFLIEPMDLTCGFQHLQIEGCKDILNIWQGCELYYFKSMLRHDVLETVLQTPAQDLGTNNAERCRGFATELMIYARTFKRQLAGNIRNFYRLQDFKNQFGKLLQTESYLPKKVVENVEDILKKILSFIGQLEVYLKTCPEDDATLTEVIILRPESNFINLKNDILWSETETLLNSLRNLTGIIGKLLEKSQLPPKYVVENIPEYFPVNAEEVASKLKEIITKCDGLIKIFGCTFTAKELTLLKDEVKIVIEEMSISNEESDKTKLIKSSANKITRSLKNSIEIFENRYKTIAETTEEDLEDNHLTELIFNNLNKDFNTLYSENSNSELGKFIQLIYSSSPKQLQKNLQTLLPLSKLLARLADIYKYLLTQQTSSYRIVCKMSSIISNIFIELASKGFCTPPDMEEGENDAEGKPSNGLGLGEGQGEKDVSDRIESEDQLDDARPDGEEREENNEDCKEEEKAIEMSEDFEGNQQDVQHKDDSEEEENSEDGEEQMGETEENADKKEKETFGEDGLEDEDLDKEEKGDSGEKTGEKELGAKEKDSPENEDQNSGKNEEKKKEINELEDPEFDDEQIDPYHGNQPELPEPEPMDLPEDLQLDDGQDNEKEDQNEENPFDIDTMKEDNPKEEEEEKKNDEEVEGDEVKDYSSEDEEITKGEDHDKEAQDEKEDEEMKENKTEENDEEVDRVESGLDQLQSNQDDIEAMDVETSEASDKTQSNNENTKANQSIEDLCQEDKPDKSGVGQSQMEETTSGHSSKTNKPQKAQQSKKEDADDTKKKRKPGESDAQRSLGDTNEPVMKKLKTSEDLDEEGGVENEENEEQAEMYKHIKEATGKTDQVLDVATEEQAEAQQREEMEDSEDEEGIIEDEEIAEDLNDVQVQKPKNLEENAKEKTNNQKKQHPEGELMEETKVEDIEGDVVKTIDVPRGNETSYHTTYEELKKISAARLTLEEMNTLRTQVEKQLSEWKEPPNDREADETWRKISSLTSSLAQDLSEQLRLVLEPTQASRLRGDFRTGRRINMRKVIPYIASQFRKDKIWLRRTKPSKRDYQIVLAIDDSASMSDNHSKELAFESVALISKALTLLESGELSVVSFGESTDILHKLTDSFTEGSGVKLLQTFKFEQTKTCVGNLVDFVSEMFEQSLSTSSALNAKLLVIISDGRGVFSEGETYVKQAIRRARLNNIFMVFIIVDNPESKSSVLDIRMPIFREGKLAEIQNYMDVFPFPFYVILRDINCLPNVLSDALRQWFEVVSNIDK